MIRTIVVLNTFLVIKMIMLILNEPNSHTIDYHSSASVMCSCPQIQKPDHFHILHEEIQESNKRRCFIDTVRKQ